MKKDGKSWRARQRHLNLIKVKRYFFRVPVVIVGCRGRGVGCRLVGLRLLVLPLRLTVASSVIRFLPSLILLNNLNNLGKAMFIAVGQPTWATIAYTLSLWKVHFRSSSLASGRMAVPCKTKGRWYIDGWSLSRRKGSLVNGQWVEIYFHKLLGNWYSRRPQLAHPIWSSHRPGRILTRS